MRILSSLVLIAAAGCGGKPEGSASSQSAGSGAAKSATSQTPVAHKPDKAFPPADWTHKELAEYLKQRGVEKIRVQGQWMLDRPDRVAAAIVEPAPNGRTGYVVYLCKDADAARDQAGALDEGFAAGRFALGFMAEATAVDREVVPHIVAALKR